MMIDVDVDELRRDQAEDQREESSYPRRTSFITHDFYLEILKNLPLKKRNILIPRFWCDSAFPRPLPFLWTTTVTIIPMMSPQSGFDNVSESLFLDCCWLNVACLGNRSETGLTMRHQVLERHLIKSRGWQWRRRGNLSIWRQFIRMIWLNHCG